MTDKEKELIADTAKLSMLMEVSARIDERIGGNVEFDLTDVRLLLNDLITQYAAIVAEAEHER